MMDDAKVVERIVSASFDAWTKRMVETGQCPEAEGKTAADLSGSEREFAEIHARACMRAYRAALADSGYVIVPRHPTPEMYAAANAIEIREKANLKHFDVTGFCALAGVAMIEAADEIIS